jgi:hypothetical protein
MDEMQVLMPDFGHERGALEALEKAGMMTSIIRFEYPGEEHEADGKAVPAERRNDHVAR